MEFLTITTGSFTYEDADGNEQTVTGSLAIVKPDDTTTFGRGGSNLGNVAFVTDPETSDDAGDNSDPAPARKTAAKTAARHR